MQVNIIPVIAKADTISKSELHKFKIKIMSELVSNGVQIYQFPTEDEAVTEINSTMNVSMTLFLSLTHTHTHTHTQIKQIIIANILSKEKLFYNKLLIIQIIICKICPPNV